MSQVPPKTAPAVLKRCAIEAPAVRDIAFTESFLIGHLALTCRRQYAPVREKISRRAYGL